jgi:proline racemase
MSASLSLDAVEVHAAGEPGRVITDAADLVHGDTMPERLAYCREHLQWLRELLLHEPRGNPALCAVLVLPPTDPASDFGMVVLEQGGFTPMSGSNTMCAVTAAIETGLVTATGPTTLVTIDTAVGTVTALARVHDGKVVSVTVTNVPAYVVELGAPLDVPGIGTIEVDVAFGGQFFVQARAADCLVDLDPSRGRDLLRAGALVKMAAQRRFRVRHPLHPDIAEISLVMLHSGPPMPGRDARNTVVLTQGPLDPARPDTWTGTLDRSPCGTGTCARMAALHARGQLAVGEDFTHRSIIDSRFTGRLTATTTVAGYAAVVPTITGQAWVIGRSRWLLDPTDPFPRGYTVGDLWGPSAHPTRQEST